MSTAQQSNRVLRGHCHNTTKITVMFVRILISYSTAVMFFYLMPTKFNEIYAMPINYAI